MFYLRSISVEGAESNRTLSDYYEIVHSDYDGFKEYLKMFPDLNQESIKNCFGVLLCGQVIPLYKGVEYYIMTENGNTFANITYK